MPRSKRTTTNTTTPSNPEGFYLDSPKNKWQIGPEIGRGACGSVHRLLKRDVPNEYWVVKIAPLPSTPTTATTKRRKKKKSMEEINADLLYYENSLYRNVLNDMVGCMVPDVPMAGGGSIGGGSGKSSPIGFGDIEGYRFVVMERMEEPLSGIIPYLSSSSSSKKTTLPLGPIASRLITLLQTIHSHNLVFVDVKPENFMLGPSSSSSSSPKSSSSSASSMSSKDLANRIRMIDLGLVESYLDVTLRSSNKHRLDESEGGGGSAACAGTPMYASRNVLRGCTISRRDDLEAVGYVICELVLQLMDYIRSNNGNGKQSKKKKKNVRVVNEGLLPWSNATSDVEVLEQKEKAIDGSDGGMFWKSLGGGVGGGSDDSSGNVGGRGGKGKKKSRKKGTTGDANDVVGVLKEYFRIVSELEYKETPDYDRLRSVVDCLEVSMVVKDDNYIKEDMVVMEEEDEEVSINVDEKEEEDVNAIPSTNEDTIASSSSSRPRRRTTRTTARRRPLEPTTDELVVKETKPTGSITTTRKRKTRTSQRIEGGGTNAHLDGNNGGGEKEEVEGKRTSVAKTKQRKKRVTTIEKRIITTVELIDDSEDENDNDDISAKNGSPMTMNNHQEDDGDVFVDAEDFEEDVSVVLLPNNRPNQNDGDDYAECDDDDMEMMTTNDEYEADEGSCFHSCHASTHNDNFSDGHSDVEENHAVPMEIDVDTKTDIVNDEAEKENRVNSVAANEGGLKKRRNGAPSSSPSPLTKRSTGVTTTNTIKKGSNDTTTSATTKAKCDRSALQLVCTEGPHSGEVIDVYDTVTLGRNPGRKKGSYVLGNDDAMSAKHALATLNRSGKGKNEVLSIKVADLKSENGTYVNGRVLVSGGRRQVFAGGCIRLGDSQFVVRRV